MLIYFVVGFASDPIIGPHVLLEEAVALARKGAWDAGKVSSCRKYIYNLGKEDNFFNNTRMIIHIYNIV